MTPARPPVDAVVVGAGLMGRWHAREIRRTGGTVRAVVDPDLTRARELAARHREARAFPGLNEAVKAVPADAAHVCSPTGTHVEIVEAAMDVGLHVLVEKPMASRVSDVRRLLERAGRDALILCPVHQFLFQRGARRLAGRMGPLGTLRQVDATFRTAGGRGMDATGLRRLAGEILPHPLSLFQRFLPGGLEGLTWWSGEAAAGEQRVVGLGEGLCVGISLSTRARPTCADLFLSGEGGSARLNLYHGYAVSLGGGVSRVRKAALPFLASAADAASAATNLALRAVRWQPAYPGLRELVRRFHQAVGGGEAPVTPDAVLAVAEARERILSGLPGDAGD